MKNKQLIVEKAWEDRSLLDNKETRDVIEEVIALIDYGKIRVAELLDESWKVNEWIKKAIMLYFPIKNMEVMEAGPFEYHDVISLKKNYDKLQVRVVPPAVARYGSYLAPGVVMMPSYVNIGAHIDSGTLIDTWATVGSCSQIGKNVHIGGSVNIGGVLKPVQAIPVIIEDHCFIGSNCNITEGVLIEKESIIGAHTVISRSTKIIDVSEIEQVEYKGFIPARSVVIQGYRPKKFQAGEFNIPVALIIGKRKESIDKKASLEDALRLYNVST